MGVSNNITRHCKHAAMTPAWNNRNVETVFKT